MIGLSFAEARIDVLDAVSGEALFLPVYEDERPPQGLTGEVDWRMGGRISALMASGHLRGSVGDALMLPVRVKLPFETLYLYGVGPCATLNLATFSRGILGALRTIADARLQHVYLQLPRRSSSGAIQASDAAGAFMDLIEHASGIRQAVLLDEASSAQAYTEAYNRYRLVKSAAELA